MRIFNDDELALILKRIDFNLDIIWNFYQLDDIKEKGKILSDHIDKAVERLGLYNIEIYLSDNMVAKNDFEFLSKFDTLKLHLIKRSLLHNFGFISHVPTSLKSCSKYQKIEINKIRFVVNTCIKGKVSDKRQSYEKTAAHIDHTFELYQKEFLFIQRNRSEVFDKWLLNRKKKDFGFSECNSVEDIFFGWISALPGSEPSFFEGGKQSSLELEITKIRQAWGQKKHRDSQNGKKACSYMLSEEHIVLLEKLCKRNRRKKNEMIEILIEDACEQLGITKKPPRM